MPSDIVADIFNLPVTPLEFDHAPDTRAQSYWHTRMSKMPSKMKGEPALDGAGQPIAGSHFVKRFLIHASRVHLDAAQGARFQARVDPANFARVLRSFQEKGFDPFESGEGLIVERINKTARLDRNAPEFGKEVSLLSGHHRYDVQRELSQDGATTPSLWSWLIVDEYEYATPLARATHAGSTNCHRIAKSAATINDISMQISRAYERRFLPIGDAEKLTAYVKSIAAHLSEKDREKLVRTALKHQDAPLAGGKQLKALVPNSSVLGWDTNTHAVEHQIIRVDLPMMTGNPMTSHPNSYNDLQTYSSDEGSISKCLNNGMKRWMDAGYPSDRKIFSVQYVNTCDLQEKFNNSKALVTHRLKQWAKVTDALETQYQTLMHQHRVLLNTLNVQMSDTDLRAHVVKHYPVVFAGFLPQVQTPDDMRGGVPSESTLVDANGKPYDYRPLIGRVIERA